MIEAIETLPPHLAKIREAFFNWHELGFESAWHSVYATLSRRTAEPQPAGKCFNCNFANLRTWEPSMMCDECVRNGGKKDLFQPIVAEPSPAPSGEEKFTKQDVYNLGIKDGRAKERADLLANPPLEWLDVVKSALNRLHYETSDKSPDWTQIGDEETWHMFLCILENLTPNPVEHVTIVPKCCEGYPVEYEAQLGGKRIAQFINRADAKEFAARKNEELAGRE